jgi:hypothetical protein
LTARFLLVFSRTSCGGILPLLLENDDDEAPPPPPVVAETGPVDAEMADVVDESSFGDGACEIAGLTCTEATRCCGSASECRLGTCCIRPGPSVVSTTSERASATYSFASPRAKIDAT